MRRHLSKLLLPASALLGISCSAGFTVDSQSQSDVSVSVEDLLHSGVTLFQFNSESIVRSNLTTGAFTLTNLITKFPQSIESPVDLIGPLESGVVFSESGVRLNPSLSRSDLVSLTNKAIRGRSTTLVLVLGANSRGEVLSFNSFERENQSFSLSQNATEVIAKFKSSSTDFFESRISKGSLTQNVVVASFADDGSIDLSLNGKLVVTATSQGSPGEPLEVGRVLSLGPNTSGETADFKEVLVFGRNLKRAEQSALISYLGVKHKVDVQIDSQFAHERSDGSVDPNFAPVETSLAQKCLSCHADWSGAKPAYFASLGLIVRGDPLASKMYYRLTGSEGPNGPKSMPTSGTISSSEVALFKKWIEESP